MITRALTLIAIACAVAAPVQAQEIGLEKPGDYILLLDKDKHPVAGSYRIGPGVKMAVENSNTLPKEPIYLDRAFFPQREAIMLAFYNARHAYAPDPAAVDVGEEARIVDHETLLPPRFEDQDPESDTAIKLTVSARVAFSLGDHKITGKSYRLEGYEPGQKDRHFGDLFHIETLDMVLSADAMKTVVSMETGAALSSGDFYALYAERLSADDGMGKCLAAKRQTAEYKALAERQRAGVDALMATGFLSEGDVFWKDTTLYEDAYSMSIFQLCPN